MKKRKFRVINLEKEKGKAIKYILQCKYLIVDTTMWVNLINDWAFFFIPTGRIVQLWHGVPLKRIDWEIISPIKIGKKFSWLKNIVVKFKKSKGGYLLVNKREFKDLYFRAFGAPFRKLIISNLPRNDALDMKKLKYLKGWDINVSNRTLDYFKKKQKGTKL